MRLPGGLQITKRKPPAPDEQREPPAVVIGTDDRHPYGDLALEYQVGIYGDEAFGPMATPELDGPLKYEWYDRMRRSDASVKSSLWMVKQPLRSAAWSFDPASEDPVDLLVADAAEWQFGLGERPGPMDATWSDQLSQMLMFFDHGAIFEEDVWGDEVVEWRDANGDVHLLLPITRFAPRFAATVEEIDRDPRRDRIRRLRQNTPGRPWIPGDKLSAFVLDREGSNWLGTSLLRPMYGPWRLKTQMMVSSGIAWDRWASGLPEIRSPLGELAKAQELGAKVRSHEQGYVAFEGAEPLPGGEGWSFNLHDTAKTIADPVPLIRLYSQMIAVSALQHFANLGSSETGSRAVGDVLVDPFYQACQSFGDQIRETIMRGKLRRWVDVNFGPDVDVPQLRVGKIQARNVTVLAAALAEFASANIYFTDRDTQNDIRDLLELPQIADDDELPGPRSDGSQPPVLPANVGLALNGAPAPGEGDGLQRLTAAPQ